MSWCESSLRLHSIILLFITACEMTKCWMTGKMGRSSVFCKYSCSGYLDVNISMAFLWEGAQGKCQNKRAISPISTDVPWAWPFSFHLQSASAWLDGKWFIRSQEVLCISLIHMVVFFSNSDFFFFSRFEEQIAFCSQQWLLLWGLAGWATTRPSATAPAPLVSGLVGICSMAMLSVAFLGQAHLGESQSGAGSVLAIGASFLPSLNQGISAAFPALAASFFFSSKQAEGRGCSLLTS